VREGFSEATSLNLNRNGLISHNSLLASELTFSRSRRRLRRFAPVFGFCQLDVTHNVTRGGRLGGFSPTLSMAGDAYGKRSLLSQGGHRVQTRRSTGWNVSGDDGHSG
jgi:hypothetical protein